MKAAGFEMVHERDMALDANQVRHAFKCFGVWGLACSHGVGVDDGLGYRGTSLIRNTHPHRVTIGALGGVTFSYE